jgi:flagellar hook-associated protein 3 FlgL
MRISTAQIYQQGLNAMLEQQGKLNRTQSEIASGQRILTPADDPSGAAQILNLNEEIATVEQYARNIDAARVKLSQEETALDSAGTVLQRVRELVVEANNDSQNTDTRRMLATEVRAQLDALLATANARDANGEYLFAGFQSTAAPFAFSGGGLVYSGDQGQRSSQTGPASQTATGDSGAEVFQFIRAGNGVFTAEAQSANTGSGVIAGADVTGTFAPDVYALTFSQPVPDGPISYQVNGAVSGVVATGTYAAGEQISFGGTAIKIDGAPANGDAFSFAPSPHRDLFTSVQAIAAALEAPSELPADRARLHNALNAGLENLDRGIEHLVATRSRVGSRLAHLDTQGEINADYALQVKEMVSSTGDLDYAEAISRLNLQTVALQAAQQAYIKVQGLSLFNLL